MKKFMLISSMMLCLSSIGQAMTFEELFSDSEYGRGKDFDFGEDKGGKNGNESNLIFQLYNDQSRGENPSELKEIKGYTGRWNWDNPAKRLNWDRSLQYPEMNPKELKAYETKKMKMVFEEYASKKDGGAQLSADIKDMENTTAELHNLDLIAKREYLVEIAKRVNKVLHGQHIKTNTADQFANFSPSKQGEGYNWQQSLEDAQLKHIEAKKSKNHVLIAAYDEIIKKLHNIKKEAEKFTSMSDDNLEEAIKKAKKAEGAAISTKDKDLYQEVIALLQEEHRLEGVAGTADEENLDAANTAMINLLNEHNKSAVHALQTAEEKLVDLKNELKSFQKRRLKTREKETEKLIVVQEHLIKKLKEQSKKSETDDKLIAQKIEEFVAKHDGDVIEAFKESLIKGYKGVIAIRDAEFADIIRDVATEKSKRVARQLTVDERVADKLEELAIKENKKLGEEKGIKEAAMLKAQQHADPEKALQDESSKLTRLKIARRNEVAGGAKVTSDSIKKQDLEIKNLEALVKRLEIEKEEFDQKVDRRYQEVLQLKNGNKKDALESLLPPSGYGSRLYGAVWDAKAVLQDRIEKIVTDITFIDKDNTSVQSQQKRIIQQKVAQRLREELRAAQAQSIKDDPVARAQAKLAAAGPFEVAGATTELAEAVLAKGGISMQNLPAPTQDALKEVLLEGSERIKQIAESPNLSELKKAEQRQIVSRGLVNDIFTLCSPSFLGISRGGIEAAAKGDYATAAVDAGITRMINGMQRKPQSVDVY